MTQTFLRDRFTWLAYVLLAFYSYFLNILGPITPFLKDELRLSYTVSSLHFTAFATGMLLVGLGGHTLIRRMGRWQSLWVGAGGVSLGALLLIAGKSPLITIGASFIMGVIGSLIIAVVPSALADQHGELRAVALSEANMVSSAVSAAAPLMVGWFAHLMGHWRLALGIMAFAPILIRLVSGKAGPPETVVARRDPFKPGGPLPFLYWVYWFALLLSVAVEFCMIFWSADYLEQGFGMLKAEAAQAVSLFLVGFIFGRLAGSRLVQRFSTLQLVTASILLASAGFLVYWRGGSILFGVAGLFITGLGVANLYPMILSLAIASAGENTVQASARATLASGVAIIALPLALGRLADSFGIRPAYAVVALLLVSVFVIVQSSKKLSFARQPITK